MTWNAIETAPLNRQVIVRHRDGVGGEVCDIACFIGRQPDGEMRWIMADIRLESRQLVAWHEIPAFETNKNEGQNYGA